MNFQGRRFKNGESLYSEWFQRGGDHAIFRAEMINAYIVTSGSITVRFEFYTKNRDETGDGSVVKNSSNNVYQLQIAHDDTAIQQIVAESTTTANQGFEELVRVKATVDANDNDNWLLGRLFPPVWYDASQPA